MPFLVRDKFIFWFSHPIRVHAGDSESMFLTHLSLPLPLSLPLTLRSQFKRQTNNNILACNFYTSKSWNAVSGTITGSSLFLIVSHYVYYYFLGSLRVVQVYFRIFKCSLEMESFKEIANRTFTRIF